MTCGVYRLVNCRDGKVYVGSSNNVEHRFSHHHRHRLRRNIHWNPHLQAAWNRDGEAAFKFELVEAVALELLLVREQYWMDLWSSFDRRVGYNISPTANRSKWSEESRAKASRTRKGRAPVPAGWHHTSETKTRISNSLKGRPKAEFSADHKEKLGARVRGKTYEELYGPEKAQQMRITIREKMRGYHERRKASKASTDRQA